MNIYIKLILKSFLILFILSFCIQAQVRNGDFEQWLLGEPVGWLTNNSSSENAYPITQAQKSYTGALAVKGAVIKISDPEIGSFLRNPQLSSISVRNEAMPIATRTRQVRGYLMFQPKGNESFFIDVSVYKNVGDQKKGLGYGSYTTTKYDSAYRAIFIDINYLDSTATPDSMVISCNISGSLHEGSVFYLDDLEFSIALISPADNDIIISGEKDTLRWMGGNKRINLLYSVDNGNTFETIVTNFPADSEKYIWEVPKELLSRKGVLRIEDSKDSKIKDERAVKFKPWQLTRVKVNGDFELYEPGQDGWAFCNCDFNAWPISWWEQFNYYDGTDPNTSKQYPRQAPFQSALSDDFPDWPLFVKAFGIHQCYYGSGKNLTYKTKALTKWSAVKEGWGGSCYGFAVTSLLYFYHKSTLLSLFSEIGDFQNLFTAKVNEISRLAINKYFLDQFGALYETYDNQRQKVDARQTLQELKDMLGQDNVDARPLGFYNPKPMSSGGHEVTAYALDRIRNTSRFNVRCYDSNNPGLTNRGIIIDSLANTWAEATGFGWGKGKTGCTLGIQSIEHFNTPVLAKRNILSSKSNNNFDQSSPIELYNSSNSDIIISSASGEIINFKDSSLINDINNAIPIIPKIGQFHPPIGYYLPKGKYSIRLTNNLDTFSYIFFIDDSTIYNYRRYDVNPNESDNLSFSDGLEIKNTDEAAKTINLQTIIDEETSEKDFEVNNIEVVQDDSISIREMNRNNLLMKNYGAEKKYDIKLRDASNNGEKNFYHAQVQL